jgi:hypothetical protein
MDNFNNEFTEIKSSQDRMVDLFSYELNISKSDLYDMIKLLKSNNTRIENKMIKDIFKILINYTYKLRKSEIDKNEEFQQNFKKINEAIAEIRKEMQKIIKEPTSELPPPPPS